MRFEGRVCVIGLGRVGLPTAALFADAGLEVLGVDRDPAVVAAVNSGKASFREPGLAELLARAVGSGRLRAATHPSPAEAFIIAVPTPLRETAGDPVPDLSHVEDAARAVAPVLHPGNLVVVESTVSVGTTEHIAAMLQHVTEFPLPLWEGVEGRGHSFPPFPFHLAHCPERAMPGRTLAELAATPRLIGGLTPAAADRAALLYARVTRAELCLTDARTAELTKLAENAYRDVSIAFANEIRAARRVNDVRAELIVADVERHAALLDNPVIACLGQTYKKDSDDLRNSAAVRIVRMLAERRVGTLLVVEPNLAAPPASCPRRQDPSCCTADALSRAHDEEYREGFHSLEFAVTRASIVLLLVDHTPFIGIDRALLSGRQVIDPHGAWVRHDRRSDHSSAKAAQPGARAFFSAIKASSISRARTAAGRPPTRSQ